MEPTKESIVELATDLAEERLTMGEYDLEPDPHHVDMFCTFIQNMSGREVSEAELRLFHSAYVKHIKAGE